MKPKMYLISNMYPSSNNVRYGIFVKNFESVVKDKFDVHKIVLTKTYSVLSKAFGYFILYIKTIGLFFKGSKDIVYVHFPLHLAPALLLISVLKKNMILNFHGSDLIFDSYFKKTMALFLKPIIYSSRIVVPSQYYKEKVLKMYKCGEKTILVYPSGGINTEVFFPCKYEKRQLFTFGFVSNFIKEKGWEVFLKAMVELKHNDNFTDFKIEMVGDGPDKEKVQAFIKSHNLPVTITSNLLHQELATLYNSFDLFIFPTYREAESLGLVGLEAMACGVPVIASKVGGPMGYVEEGKNGYLFEIKDVRMLVQKIKCFHSLSTKNKIDLSNYAIKTSQKYDSKKVLNELILFLKQ